MVRESAHATILDQQGHERLDVSMLKCWGFYCGFVQLGSLGGSSSHVIAE